MLGIKKATRQGDFKSHHFRVLKQSARLLAGAAAAQPPATAAARGAARWPRVRTLRTQLTVPPCAPEPGRAAGRDHLCCV